MTFVKKAYKPEFSYLFMGFWFVVERVIREADITLFVLDARMPELSRNPQLEGFTDKYGKPLIMVFTKIDLVTPERLSVLQEKYPDAFFVSGTKNVGLKPLKIHLLVLGKRKGKASPKVGVVGYPNVGKSAIINALAHRARARVSPKAGTTRGVQFVRAGSLRILDSPGVIPYEDNETKLGLLAAKNVEKIKDPERVAIEVIKLFLEKDRVALEAEYGIVIRSEEPIEIIEQIGRRRGFLKRGGIVDEVKSAMTLVRDWQTGKLKL